MEGRIVCASCRTTDLPTVEAALREWDDVEAVGSFREKQNNKGDMTSVFITFSDEEAAKAAADKLETLPGLIRETTSSANKGTSNKSRQKKKNLASEFLKYESYEERKRSEENAKRKAEKQKNNNNNRGDGEQPKEGGRSRRGGRAGRGGRGRSGAGGGRSGRGGAGGQGKRNQHQQGRRQQRQRLPPIEANVAFADNVPFGATNNQLMDLFAPYGRVLDINRLELMAMVCYDNPESVQQCIQHLNGTQINGNYVTVSSGTVRVPGHIALHMGI